MRTVLLKLRHATWVVRYHRKIHLRQISLVISIESLLGFPQPKQWISEFLHAMRFGCDSIRSVQKIIPYAMVIIGEH